MATTALFTIGAEVSCTDGVCGKLRRVIVDPVAEAVTHLAVEPRRLEDRGRLVPLDLVDATTGEIRLHCTLAEFEQLDPAEETEFIQGTGDFIGYGPGEVGYWPYYGLGGGLGPVGGGIGLNLGAGAVDAPVPVTSDAVPPGKVEIRRGDQVQATDGDIGRVQGLVIDRATGHVTHVLLQEGHLWGKKEVAIPISAVASTSEGIKLTITKQDVQELPTVDIDHPDFAG
jgi:sporulation protein YlmC with PRC-barrel domain